MDQVQTQGRLKELRACHPIYRSAAAEWEFFLSAYEGGSDFTRKDNLFKHVRENEEDYQDRVKRLHNMNYCEPITDFFTNFIFSETIERTSGTSDKNSVAFQEFLSDVNRKGDNIDDFMRQVSDDIQIFGMSYIMVDTPAFDQTIVQSKAQEQEKGIRPYWVLIKPDEVLDWVVDEFLNFKYLKRRYYEDTIVGGKHRTIEVYTEMYPTEYITTRVDTTNPNSPKILSETATLNSLGKIPVYVARFKRSKKTPYLGLSFLRDFAYNQREIMNLTSLLQEFLYRQAFNILAKEVDTSLPMVDQQEGVIGTSNVLEVPKGAAMPAYITPPSAPAEFIRNECMRIKQEMFIRAAQDTMNELFNGEKSSGFSQAQSFSKTVPFISSRAETLERTEIELMKLTYECLGSKWTGKIKYKDRYEITNLTDTLTQLLMIFKDLALPSETFVKATLKDIVKRFDGKLSPELVGKIENEIETMDFKKWQEKIGSKAKQPSPGAQQRPNPPATQEEIAAEGTKTKTASTKKLRGQ